MSGHMTCLTDLLDDAQSQLGLKRTALGFEQNKQQLSLRLNVRSVRKLLTHNCQTKTLFYAQCLVAVS